MPDMPSPRPYQPKPITAIGIMQRGIGIMKERGLENAGADMERSFGSVATAFNAITGKDFTAAEVALILQILKDVRQWSDQTRLHKDSIIDCVNYAALKGEELFRQFKTTK